MVKKHYQKGYFDYNKDGFGPSFEEIDSVLNYLDELEKNNYKNPIKYSKRSKNFYKYRDKNNRERTYNEIIKM